MGRKTTDWKKRLVKDTADKGLLSKRYKEILKPNKKKIDNLNLKMNKRPQQTPH